MEAQQIHEIISGFSKRAQIAFMTSCIEHLYPILEIVCEEGEEEIIKQMVELNWRYVESGVIEKGAVKQISTSLDELLDEDSYTQFLEYAAAAELAVLSLEDESKTVLVLN